jgi:hypothetical protein
MPDLVMIYAMLIHFEGLAFGARLVGTYLGEELT